MDSSRPTTPALRSHEPHYAQVLIPIERVAPGMFPTEAALTVRAHDGTHLTLFADRHLIEHREDGHQLRVTRMRRDDAAGVTTCLLPVEPEDGSRWLRVATAAVLET